MEQFVKLLRNYKLLSGVFIKCPNLEIHSHILLISSKAQTKAENEENFQYFSNANFSVVIQL